MTTPGASVDTVVLETGRLILRRLHAGDAGFILDLLNQPSFIRFIGDRGVRTLDDARGYIASGPEASYHQHGFGLYAVVPRDGALPIGMCGVMKKHWLEHPDLAYAFLPQFGGKGYAFEAASAVLAHERAAHALERVIAVVTPDNAGSIRLLEKLGMVFERTEVSASDGAELRLYGTPPAPEATPGS